MSWTQAGITFLALYRNKLVHATAVNLVHLHHSTIVYYDAKIHGS